MPAEFKRDLRKQLERQRRLGGPRYEQLQRALRELIRQGVAGPGALLPAERELARLTGWSRVTVRRALGALAKEAVISARPGAGTYVGERIVRSFSRLTSFTDDLRARGWDPRVKFLARETGEASSEEAMALAISPGSPVVRLHRLRSAGERPLAVERSVVPQDILPRAELVTDSLYEALERLAMRPERALQRLHAVALDATNARLLGVAPGTPALHIERRAFLADGRAVEFTRSMYLADAYDFVAELRRH